MKQQRYYAWSDVFPPSAALVNVKLIAINGIYLLLNKNH